MQYRLIMKIWGMLVALNGGGEAESGQHEEAVTDTRKGEIGQATPCENTM
jgi:hypothetical protein